MGGVQCEGVGDMEKKYKTYFIAEIIILASFCSILAGSEAKELGVKIERNVPVKMRDGTILRADVYRPDRGGPYPVLVQRTPNGKGGNFNRFVKAGYIVVSQDVRGCFESEGKWEFLKVGRHDAEDGYDTIEWAAKLPGSNHKVGTFGRSTSAGLQWLLASLRPPSLVAMSAQSVTARRYDQEPTASIRPYVFLWGFATFCAPDMRRRANRPGVHTRWEADKLWEQGVSKKWVNFLPWLELPQELFQDQADNVKHWLNNPQFIHVKRDESCKNISVPNLDVTGWYDFCNNDMLLFRTMVKEARAEVARKGSRIIVGPWSHVTAGQRRVYSFDFGPNAALDNIAVQIRWFDYWLKGKQNGVDKDPPVRIFVMGDNKWRDEQRWPLRRAKDIIFFPTSGGHANTSRGDGKLIRDKPEQPSTDQYVYDPDNPVPTLGDSSRLLIPRDQRPLADRKDILVYQTEPLVERVEVTGNPVVELYAASSAPDTDWFVRLIDVAPDGLARNVSMGVVRARYREGFDKPKLLKPGEAVKYTIRMNPTSNAFLPGHRIRLDITSSDFPNYDRNHNTAANQNADATLVTARQTIYHGAEQATRIILPWVPNPREEEKSIEEKKPEPKPKKQMYHLHQAAADGDIEQVKLLISKGADVNSKDEKEKIPLHYAAKSGKMEVVQLLVEAGSNVNAMGNNDWPPLCIAAGNDHIAVAEYLIAHGADVNPDNDWTPLQQAPYSSSVEMVELLIAKGADINAGPWTALNGAVNEGRRDIAELLIQKGADVNAKDKRGHSPLYYAIRNKDLDMKTLLITKGADIDMKPPEGLTLLQYVASEGHRDIAELLLAKGAKVDEKDDVYEFTALHYAARFGHKDIAEFLIAKGADINAKDKWDYQPIHVAAHHDRADVVELLISKGADINAKTSLNQTPLQLAQERRNTKTVKLLRKHGAKE